MFTITTEKLSKKSIDNWNNRFEYNCVYILANKKDAYIGQTFKIGQRAEQHITVKNYIKDYNFKTVHIIRGGILDGFDRTTALHFEYLLLKLMRVDGKLHVVNRNFTTLEPYNRMHTFENYFDELWPELVKNNIVKQREFKTIINTSAYKYSPDTLLNHPQQKALDATISAFDSGSLNSVGKNYKERVVLVNGSADIGKTVFTTSLLHYFKTNENFKYKKVALVYSQPSMRESIREAAKAHDGLDAKDILDIQKLYLSGFDL